MAGHVFHGTPAANREEWFQRCADLLTSETRELLAARGNGLSELTVPRVRISCAFPVGTRGGSGAHAIGQCWHGSVSGDGTFEVFVSPEIAEPARAADILAHELVHAIDRLESGHRGRFKQIAQAIGLDGPMTATVAGDELAEWLSYLPARIGPYPHAAMSIFRRLRGEPPAGDPGSAPPIITDKPPKQGTRQRKITCTSCGFIARTTRGAVDKAGGLPTCACGTEMQWADETEV